MTARRVTAQARMELRLLLRNGENLLVTLAIPVALLVFFSTVDVLDLGDDPVGFLLPGMLAVAVMATGMVSLAIHTGFERSYLVLKRLGATPLRRWELMVAKIAAVVVIEMIQVLVLVTAAVALGWRMDVHVGGVAAAVGAVAAGTAAFVGIGLGMAGRLRAVATLALSNAIFVALLVVSGVVFPLDSLPQGLAAAARLTPAAALASLLRAATGAAASYSGAVAVLAAWALAAPAAAAALFRWSEEP